MVLSSHEAVRCCGDKHPPSDLNPFSEPIGEFLRPDGANEIDILTDTPSDCAKESLAARSSRCCITEISERHLAALAVVHLRQSLS